MTVIIVGPSGMSDRLAQIARLRDWFMACLESIGYRKYERYNNIAYHEAAISVDNELMIAADRAAREIGISRRRLFSLALEDYLRNREHDRIVEQLKCVYGGESDIADKRVAGRLKTKFRSTIKERW